MRTWTAPKVPALPGTPPPLRLYDSATGKLVEHDRDDLRMWICGITPYDSTHFGHANTYVAFDTLSRVWLDGGRQLATASNVTDIDDPLFDRAAETGQNWFELAQEQTQLFREDMEFLRILPPDSWTSITEILDPLEELIRKMEKDGTAYRVPSDDGTEFIYADISRDRNFAIAPIFDGMDLIDTFDERGGDSKRPGKRNKLDPQLWKGVVGNDYRPGSDEPGRWRPGWHIQCALMALQNLGVVDVHAGGKDLIFPHHEMSEHHMREMTQGDAEVEIHAHAAMVSYEGEKMSKSLGNLIFVSSLRGDGVDPRVIRLSILAHHYREDWEYDDPVLDVARERLARWEAGFAAPTVSDSTIDDTTADNEGAKDFIAQLREVLADDLNTLRALSIVDEYVGGRESWISDDEKELASNAIDALLGIDV